MSTSTTEIKRRLDAEVEKIRGYADLTEEAKTRRVAEAYAQAEQEYREAVAEEERKVQERAEKAERAVFEYGHPLGASDVEKAQLRALQRDAYNSVYDSLYFLEGAEAREELERLLVRAERTGDTELARAVYHIATERGERQVADAYLEKHPTEQKKWEEYVQARREANSLNTLEGRLGRMMGERLFKPPELQGNGGGDFAAAYTEHTTGGGPAA
jgi:hypothetical protein